MVYRHHTHDGDVGIRRPDDVGDARSSSHSWRRVILALIELKTMESTKRRQTCGGEDAGWRQPHDAESTEYLRNDDGEFLGLMTVD